LASLDREVRRFGVASLIYIIPTILLRGVNFLFAPLYAHSMSAAEFGRVGVASTVGTLAITVLSAGMNTTTYRLHHDWPDEASRRRFYGTVLAFLAVVPLALTAAVHTVLYVSGVELLRTLPLTPYLGLVLWSSYFGVFQAYPTNIFVAREEPRRAVTLNAVMLAITIAANLTFVVALRQGALGQIRATLAANAAIAVVGVVSVSRLIDPRPSLDQLRRALAFSLPLVPHLVVTWGLAVADRLVLERTVSETEIGCYQLAYTFANVAVVASGAMMRGLYPIIARKIAHADSLGDVPRLGTIALFGVVATCVAVGLVADDVIAAFFPPSYQPAAAYVPWLVAGAAVQGAYQILMQGTMQAKRTTLVPLVSAIALGVNLAINITFSPLFGAMAAAVATLVAYLVLAALHGALAHRSYPIQWEYRRWASLAFAAVGAVSAAMVATGMIDGGLLRACLRACIGIPIFAALLVLTGFAQARHLPALVRSILKPSATPPTEDDR
jgi:O-antigen/teichoic acid export membrane protein